jgi:predicted enzyme involved in methoxymalonyl-ACP biosynthesis
MLIYVDIDDTICHYANQEDNKNYTLALPYKNRIKKVNNLYEKGNTIVYWTARGTKTGINWFDITTNQLREWGCKYHELRMGKPAYDLFIDDKNINSEHYFNNFKEH